MEIGNLFYTVEVQGIDKVGQQLKNMGSTISSIGSSLMENVSKPILEFFGHGVKLASDISESMNVVNTVFGESGKEVSKWADNLLESFGLTEKQALNYVGAMGSMLESSGLSTEASKDMSKSLVELTGDMASFYNLKHDEVWEKLRAGIMGETEPLKSLGINMSVANMEAFALSKGINKSWNEMSQAEQVALRYDYIMEKTANAQGDFSKTSDSFANKLRTLQGRFDTLAQNIGSLLLPIFERVLIVFDNLLKYVMENIPGLDKMILVFGLLVAAIAPVITIVGALTLGLGAFITAITTIVGVVGGLISGLGLLLIPIGLVGAAFTAFGGILAVIGVSELITKFGSLKGVMEAVQLFINETLVPAFQYLASGEGLEKVQNVSDGTKNKLEAIRNTMMAIKDFIMETLVPALVYLATGNGLEKVQNASNNVINVLKILREKMVNIQTFIEDTLVPALVYLATGEGLDKVKTHGTDLKNKLEELRKTFVSIKDFIMIDLVNALKYLATGDEGSLEQAAGLSDDVKDSIKDLRDMFKSLMNKLDEWDISDIIDSFSDMLGKVNKVISALKTLKSWADKINTINPVYWAGEGVKAAAGYATGVRSLSQDEWAWVGEHGKELMHLPKGTSIYNNSEARGIMNQAIPRTNTTSSITNTSSEQFVLNGNIVIDGKTVQEFNNIIDFMQNIKKEARMR